MKFDAILEWFQQIITIVGPAIILIFTLALLAGLIRWTNKTKANIKEVAKNPTVLIIWIVVSIIIIYFFYKYAVPIVRG
jgi:uncharacterized membrane protein YidH (DUF202 family)